MQSMLDRNTASGSNGDRCSVLHVSQPGSEGVANFVRELSVRQRAEGRRVGVVCPPHSRLATTAALAGLETVAWSAERQPGPTLGREVRHLIRTIDRFEPDVVHLHSSKAGMAGRMALRGRLPTVFQPHAWSFQAIEEPLKRLAVTWERRAAPWADAVVTVSDAEKAIASRNGIHGSTVDTTIPNPVDPQLFHPGQSHESETLQLRRSLGLTTQPLVACLGRLCHQKGQDLLIRSWPAVAAAVPGAQLLLVGDGPLRPQLEPAAGMDVHFLGDRADIPEILRAVQVVAMPSRWEGMSLAMLEAMATAKPVVATDVGGAAETIGAGAGALVAAGEIERFSGELIRRLIDNGLAGREGEVGRRIVLQRHTMADTVTSMTEVYRRVLEARTLNRTLPPSFRLAGSADG